MTDWIDDPKLSAEEKLARFEALNPERTTGPEVGRVRDVEIMPGSIVWRTDLSVGSGVTVLPPVRYTPTMPGSVAAAVAVPVGA